jgi:Sulfotransferase family
MLSPWKTASQTMRLRLRPYNESPYSAFFHFNPHLNRVVHQHLTVTDFRCLPESKLEYFVGSFVRNPYDRAYAGFVQLDRDIRKQPHVEFPEPWIRSLVMNQLASNYLQLARAHFDFDRWVALIEDGQVYEAGHNSNWPLHPAHYWTHVGQEQAVDFIGRVENFEEDFRAFLARVQIDTVEDVNTNVTDLQGASKTNPFGYRYVHRMKPESIRKINRLFERDFAYFGYPQIVV